MIPIVTAVESRERGVLESAREALQRSPYPTLRRVECSLEQGQLRLHGRLDSYFHKQLAQETVMQVPGVSAVLNAVDVAF